MSEHVPGYDGVYELHTFASFVSTLLIAVISQVRGSVKREAGEQMKMKTRP